MIPSRKDIEDYFEALATSHVTLRHGYNGRKSFYRMSSEESSALTTNAASPRLQIENYGGRFSGSPEALEKPVNMVLKVLCKADANEASKQAAYDQAETIMDDIIAKLAEDALAQGDCYILRGLVFGIINFDKVGPEGQNEFGYRITIPIRNYAPSYNPAKWL